MKGLVALALLLSGCAAPVRDADLYRSRDAFLHRETEAFVARHRVDDVAALEKVWRGLGAEYPLPRTSAGPLLHTALVEVARNRAERLYRASLPYGRASSPENGMYYLAQAEASRKFAESIALDGALDGEREAPPDRDQIRAALQSLEREASALYERDPSRRTIVFNAKLQEARELLERESLAGATLTLLEARRIASPTAQGKIEVTGGTTLQATFRDQPAALALLDAMMSRTLTVTRTAEAPVTVTLIRWPYTCSLSDPASLLVRETVRRYGAQARFAVQDFGASPLAEKFGVDKYPAVFVDDALVASPEDFYAWGGAGAGRYLPWRDPAQQKEFQHDLARMIDLRLAGAITLAR